MVKTREELIKKYKEFFISKGHKEIPSSSLIPDNDPTVLFTTAGMHPLVPYLLGQKHPLGKRLVNVQRCIRTTDINFIGDEVHHTFFEMLGNWSLGDYWKEEAIKWSYEFLTNKKWLGLDKDNITITVFLGDKNAPKDTESAKVWLDVGIPKERIAFLIKEKNWWGPAGNTGPCGPDTEMFCWAGKSKAPKEFDLNKEEWVEIWNNVFMEYNKTSKGTFEPLKQKNVDTGMGVERTLAVLNGLNDNYMTEVWKPIIEKIERLSGKKYKGNERVMRIVADHIKASVFLISDGVLPGNTGQGYVLRRLIRRAIRYGKKLGVEDNFTAKIAQSIFPIYKDFEKLEKNRNFILTNLDEEENKFRSTLEKGLRQFEKLIQGKMKLSGTDAFLLFQSYGFPLEITEDLGREKNIRVDTKGFEKEFQKHQEISRTAKSGVFASGLADSSEKTKRLHTATHLLNEALRKILGKDLKQRGSNITPERLRFDFNFPRKLTAKEKQQVEALVNKKIKQGLEVTRSEMSLEDALKSGAQAEFGHKYPEKVSVYTIKDKGDKRGWFSKELCTGPHVENTKEIGKFKIVKERSIAAGIRRIKAVVE